MKYLAPKACEASSTILNLNFFDNLKISFISQVCPAKATGTKIFGNSFFLSYNKFFSNS